MNQNYLGEFDVAIKDTPFSDHKPSDWVMYFVERYSQTDGSHHKQWLLDQVARILKGSPVIVKKAKWDNGFEEYRVRLDEPSNKYIHWVNSMIGDTDKNDQREYSYDEGIAP